MNQSSSASDLSASSENRHQPLTPFRWLLLLGIPPALAAHLLAPDIFQADETCDDSRQGYFA